MDIVHKEFAKQRYIGLLTASETQHIVGPFQSSPLSLIPKPGRPGKYHMIQDLSHLRGSSSTQSINARVSPDEFTAPYSTIPIVAALLSSLPPGSQGAVRDVAKAYCTIPVHPSQWHGLVVRLSESHFAIDTTLCFSFTPSAGIYGNVAGAGVDIMRFVGIGPILRWVDDHLFIRVPQTTCIITMKYDATPRTASHRKGGQRSMADVSGSMAEHYLTDPQRNLMKTAHSLCKTSQPPGMSATSSTLICTAWQMLTAYQTHWEYPGSH